jgi:ferritin-like metal-binding protein YciE
MSLFSSATTSSNVDPALLELFKEEIKDIYWAENYLVKTLPKMAKAATSEELATAITNHLELTHTHVSRLDQVFELLGEKPEAKKCEAMNGIIKEGEGILDDTQKGTSTRDVGIILAAQKIEHYEIGTYGGLAQLAKTLGLSEVKELLGQTLSEEKEADQLFTDIAESKINYAASVEA